MTTGYWCNDCEELTEAVRVYECDLDGWKGTERRCETCNKFVSRREEDGCENCFAEVEEVEVVTDHDGAIIKASEYEPNGKPLAQRLKEADEAQKKAYARKAKSDVNELIAKTVETTWGEITPGQKIVARDWKGAIDTHRSATVLSVTVAGENCVAPVVPGSLTVVVEHYGLRLEVHNPEDSVLVLTDEVKSELLPTPDERFTVIQGNDTHGSGIRFVTANVSFAATEDRNIYLGEINGKSSAYSGQSTIIGSFFEPEEARTFAKRSREAAAELRSRALFDGEEAIAVELTEVDDVLSHAPTRYADFIVGVDDMLGGDGVRVMTSSTGKSTQSFSVLSPAVLDGIAEAAEMIANKLTDLYDLK